MAREETGVKKIFGGHRGQTLIRMISILDIPKQAKTKSMADIFSLHWEILIIISGKDISGTEYGYSLIQIPP